MADNFEGLANESLVLRKTLTAMGFHSPSIYATAKECLADLGGDPGLSEVNAVVTILAAYSGSSAVPAEGLTDLRNFKRSLRLFRADLGHVLTAMKGVS